MNWSEEQRAVAEAALKFPKEFGLRAFPGNKFCVSVSASYWDSGVYLGKPPHEAGPILYTNVWKGDRWIPFAKGTPEELEKEIVTL